MEHFVEHFAAQGARVAWYMGQYLLARRVSGKLRRWFRAHGRDLPWRRTRDPYRVLVSELMLQQTQVARVVDYYARFLERFPTVEALAVRSLRIRMVRIASRERKSGWPSSSSALRVSARVST